MLIRLSQQNDINAVDQSYRDLLLHEAQTGISHTNWALDVYPTRTTAEKHTAKEPSMFSNLAARSAPV